MKFKSDIEVQAGLRDGSDDIGTAGQILSSTGSQTNWIDQDSIVASEAKLVVIECKNTSGSTISKGTPVYQTGTVGATDVIEIDVADASDEDKMAAIGLLQTDLDNNAFGKVVITGELLNITTSPIDGVTPVTGDTIYVKSGGGLTLTKPTGVNFIQNIGLVGKVSGGNSGSITVSSIMRSNDVPTPLYIDHTNQRLGIGQETPLSKLHIKRSNSGSGLLLENSIGGSNQYIDLDFSTYNTQQSGYANAAASIRVIDNGAFGGVITFRSKTSGIGNSQIETFRVDASGDTDFVGDVSLGNNNKLTFDKTNTASGGDFNFIEMGYNGSWSANEGGLAAIEVNDGSGTVGKYGITYGTGGGRFVITDLYDGGYASSGDVFSIRGDGLTTIAGDLMPGADTTYKIGSNTTKWQEGHFDHLYIGETGSNPRIDIYTENGTASIADTFSDSTTDKSYIYFQAGTNSNDPGFIMHETSESSSPDERNEGVLHLVPSDDNSTNDYVSIHGTNDPDGIRLHTSGLIETASNYQLQIKSGSSSVYVNDDLLVQSAGTFGGNLSVNGSNLTINGAYPRFNMYSTDTGEDDYSIINNNGALGIYNVTNATYFLSLAETTGNATFSGTIGATNFSGSSSGVNTGDQTNILGNSATTTLATDSSKLGGYTLAQIDNAEAFHTFTGINAASAQAKRYHIGRLYGCPAHWDGNWQNIEFNVTAESYESGHLRYKLMGDYGGSGSQANMIDLYLKEASGPMCRRFRFVLGTPVDAGWDYSGQDTFYVDLYAEASNYSQWEINIKTYGHGTQNSNPTSGGATTVFYDSPTSSNIATFDESHATIHHLDSEIYHTGHKPTFAEIASTPNTIAGYGITDALVIGTTSTTAMAGNTTIPAAVTDFVSAANGGTFGGNVTIKHASSPALLFTDDSPDPDNVGKISVSNAYMDYSLDNTNTTASSRMRFRLDGANIVEILPNTTYFRQTNLHLQNTAVSNINFRKDAAITSGDDIGKINFGATNDEGTTYLNGGNIIYEGDGTWDLSSINNAPTRMKIQLRNSSGALQNAMMLSSSLNANFYGDLTVAGDLIVSGTTTTLNTETVEVEDNIIVLNKTQSDNSATATTSGISIYRGLDANDVAITEASLIFDDADDTWDLTNKLKVAGDLTSTGNLFLGSTGTENFIAFKGTTGDSTSGYTTTYIGEYLYGGTEKSELIIYKGNDGHDSSAAPDRIRMIGANLCFDVYNTAQSYPTTLSGVAGLTTTRAMTVLADGKTGIGTETPQVKLEVEGIILANGGSWNGGGNEADHSDVGLVIQENDFIFTKDGTNLRKLIGKTSTDIIQIGQSGTSLIDSINFYSGTNPQYSFFSNNTEIMRLNSTGLSVGHNNPQAKLDIQPTATNRKVTRISNDVMSTYFYNTQADAVLDWTCGSYYQGEVVITANQTNGGDYNNLYIRGIWSNNHTSHHWDEIERIGGLTGSTFTMSVGQNTTTNSGKLTLTFDYISASFAQLNVRVTDFYGTHSYTIT